MANKVHHNIGLFRRHEKSDCQLLYRLVQTACLINCRPRQYAVYTQRPCARSEWRRQTIACQLIWSSWRALHSPLLTIVPSLAVGGWMKPVFCWHSRSEAFNVRLKADRKPAAYASPTHGLLYTSYRSPCPTLLSVACIFTFKKIWSRFCLPNVFQIKKHYINRI